MFNGVVAWRPMTDTLWIDGRDVILQAHSMIVSARYCAGEWSEETSISAREYDGAVWSCFDDEFQFEIEEISDDPTLWEHGPVTGWLNALPTGSELATLRAQNAALIEKMTAIEHSMRMASLPGNDWKREISLSTSLARNALAQVAK